MKKLLCLLLALTFVFLSACTESEKSEGSKSESSVAESSVAESKDEESKETETSEPVSESNDTLTLADCETKVVRTGHYYGKSEFFKKALNSEKLGVEKSLALPIYKLESVEDVTCVAQILKESDYYGGIYRENEAFKSVMENADEEFFNTTTVFLTYFLSGTGSYEYLVTDVDENGTFTVAQKEYPYDVITHDLAGWFFFVFAPKEKADKLATVDAVYSTEIYKDNSPIEDYRGEDVEIIHSAIVSAMGSYMGNDCYSTDVNGNPIIDMHLTQFYADTVNKEKLPKGTLSQDGKSVPVFKFESLEEIESFKEKYSNVFSFDRSVSVGESFSEVAKRFENVDFEKYAVFMVYVSDTVCNSEFEVEKVIKGKDGLCIYVNRTEKGFSEALGGWGVFVTIPKYEIRDVSKFDAVVEFLVQE